MDVDANMKVDVVVNTSLMGEWATAGNSSSNSYQQRDHDLRLTEFGLKLILPPILIVMATCGNVVGFLVVSNSVRLNQLSAAVYLRVYFVVSTLVLFLGTGQNWICMLTGSPYLWNSTDYACRLWEFGSAVLFYFPIWLLVAFTADRWLLVSRSRHAHLVGSVFAAKVICLAILSGLVTVSVHAMWTFELLSQGQCGIPADRSDLHSLIWPWVSVTVYSFLPLALLLVCSVRLLLLGRPVPCCCSSAVSRRTASFNVHIEVFPPQSRGSRNIEPGDTVVQNSDDELISPGIKPAVNHSVCQMSGQPTSNFPQREIIPAGEVDCIKRNLSATCCAAASCSREVKKLCPWEDRPLPRDTLVSYPYLEEWNCSSGILSTTAACTALMCFVCTVPATIVNVYLMQVPAQSVFQRGEVDQLRFLFAVFQILPVMNHAIMPIVGYMTSDLVREETSAYFCKSSGADTPKARRQGDSSEEEIKVTSL